MALIGLIVGPGWAAASATTTSTTTPAAPVLTRISGTDRYDTAARIAEAAFPGGATTALLASGTSFPDALTGAYLAGTQTGGAPVLLVGPSTPVPSATLAAIRKLGVRKVVVIGGSASVDDAVVGALAGTPAGPGTGDLTVSRLSGTTRYDTMAAVDRASTTVGTSGSRRTAILVTGNGFADATGAAPLAYARHFPLVMTDGRADTLNSQARSILTADSITQVIVVGGASALSSSILSQLTSLGIRLDTTATHGTNRSETSAELAGDEIANYAFTSGRFDLARGDDFADSLAAGPLGGVQGAPTLVTNGPSDAGAVPSFLAAHVEKAGNVLGGTSALTPTMVAGLTSSVPAVTTSSGGTGGTKTGATTTTSTSSSTTSTSTSTSTTSTTTSTTTTVPLPAPVLAGSPYKAGSVGYDVSWPQCGQTLPSTGSIHIVGVNDGRAFTTNPCLATQGRWAGSSASVYLNLNSPADSSRDMTGPAGSCSSSNTSCQAYNYGANAVTFSVSAARAAGVAGAVWWLDVETGNAWSSSTSANDQVIRGALAQLAADQLTAGIYSTTYQWSVIAGSWTPDVPEWVPSGASSASRAAASCGGTYFTSGATWLVQYANASLDGDVAC